MSSVGYPDWQKITQWLGAPLVEATGLAIGAGVHDDGPFNLASWASVVVAIKPAGGAVTVTVKQMVSGGPASLELDTVFIVPAGQAVFESVVLLADAVSLHLAGGGAGVTVDYALYPSNTTTNSQAVTGAQVLIPVVLLANFPPAAPSDGQAVLLELPASYDPVGGKAIRWLCTYDAPLAVWMVQGAPLFAEVATLETTASAAFADLATVGPSISLPRGGDYQVAHGFDLGSETVTTTTVLMSYAIGAAAAVDADAAHTNVSAVQFSQSVARKREKVGLAAGASIVGKYRTAAGTMGFENRWISVLPVRIT